MSNTTASIFCCLSGKNEPFDEIVVMKDDKQAKWLYVLADAYEAYNHPELVSIWEPENGNR